MNTTSVPYDANNLNSVDRAPIVWEQCLENQHCSIAGLIRIDQTQTYSWLGIPNDSVPGLNRSLLTSTQVTPTRTIMNMTAGPLDISLTFLSPIEPADPVLQSFPFAYMSFEATSNDGKQHDVQVYADITGEWLSSNAGDTMTWSTQTTNALVYHQLALQTPHPMTEISDRIEDGTVFFAMPTASSQTFMVNTDPITRGTFVQNGTVTNQIMAPPHVIGGPYPVFAISVDLGTIAATTEPLVWTMGMTRDPAVTYTGASGAPQPRSPYWASQFNQPLDAVVHFVADYPNAVARATALDQLILDAAAAVDSSGHYADLVSLAARQVMGGTELTIGRNQSQDASGSSQWNTADVKMFMKNVGTDSRVNPVEGLYGAFPFFLYINATYGGWLLSPILEFANTSLWALPYAPRDIGNNYPNATGSTAAHNQGVEQCGNMLIMTLAHARATGDGSLIGLYHTLLKKWADYLLDNSMPLTAAQQSADTTDTKANLTNVALKGIIGIQAMAEMSAALNLSSDAQYYSSLATSLAASWASEAMSSDGQHVLTSFGDQDSSTALTYNLFADKLLSTNLVPSSLYAAQTASLKSQLSGSNSGLPIDQSLSQQANSVWSMFAAAYATDASVQSGIIDQIWRRVSSNATDTGIFSTAYRLDTGAAVNNLASPSIGGIFAPLSLNIKNVPIDVPSSASQSTGTPTHTPANSDNSASKKSSNAGAIAGGVVGGIVAVALLGVIGFMYWRKRLQRRSVVVDASSGVDLLPPPNPYVYERAFSPNRLSTTMTEGPLGQFEFVSHKSREALQDAPLRPAPVSSVSASSSGAASSPDLSNGMALGMPPVENVSDVQGLRSEIQNLRRVMQTLNEARYEPPPEYHSEVAA